jgi:DsrE/DsrF-like family
MGRLCEHCFHPERAALWERAQLQCLTIGSRTRQARPKQHHYDFLDGRCGELREEGQKTPDGYYNIERMLKRFASGSHRVLLCGTCMDGRGLTEAELVEGARRSKMDELARATAQADKVLVF